jgi:hypothetical protein
MAEAEAHSALHYPMGLHINQMVDFDGRFAT